MGWMEGYMAQVEVKMYITIVYLLQLRLARHSRFCALARPVA